MTKQELNVRISDIYDFMLDNAEEFILEKRVEKTSGSCVIFEYRVVETGEKISLYYGFNKVEGVDGTTLKIMDCYPYRIVIDAK